MKSALVNFCEPLPQKYFWIGYKKLLRVEKCRQIKNGIGHQNSSWQNQYTSTENIELDHYKFPGNFW